MPATDRFEQQGEQHGSNRACYVYGIVPADVEVDPDARGVGDPPAQVQLVRHNGIAALMSEIDVSKPLGRPEDLVAHQGLLDAAAAEAPVLPLRFGAAVTGPQAVVDELLAPHHEEFAAALDELEGRAEFVIKGRYVEDSVLKEVLSEVPEAARLREQIRAAGNGQATRELRIRLGEIVTNVISAKREEDTRKLGDAIAPYCVASNVREPTHEEEAVNLAALVETARQAELERAVEKLAADWDGRVELRVLGPLAPYDFVTTTIPQG